VGFVLFLLAVLCALLLALAVPLTVAFRIDRVTEVKGQVIFRWLFGVARLRIGIPSPAKGGPRHKKRPAKKAGKGKPRYAMRGVALLRQPAFRRRIVRFMKDLLRAVHARDLYLRLRIGLGDPADTGRLWGLLGPIAGIAASLHSAEVRIEPEFTAPVLELESHGEFHLIPLQIIAIAITFAGPSAILLAWRRLRRSNA
jgi:hypothetical protein